MLVVYKICFDDTHKCYVGITNNFERRKKKHLQNAEAGIKTKICKALRKYKNPKFEILENCLSIEELYEAENKYIKKFDSFDDGYNSTLGGEGTFGMPRPKDETWRKNHSERMSGCKNPRFGIRYSHKEKDDKSLEMKLFYQQNPQKKAWGNKSSLGYIWINNGIIEKKIKKEENIPIGWVKGRIFKNRKRNKI